LAAKRDANIKAKEEKRREQEAACAGKEKKAQSKYSRKDVLELKAVFDEYDKDGSGQLDLAEFTKSLKEKKDKAKPRPGQKSTLAERNASQGISIADLSENTFHAMDTDGNGEVTFEELLKLFFKYATPNDIKVMMSYIAAPPEPEPEPEPTMTPEQVVEIKKMFKLYDKDKSGLIDKAELLNALKATGLERDEIKEMFEKADTSGDGKIDVKEFTKMMEDTGAFYDN